MGDPKLKFKIPDGAGTDGFAHSVVNGRQLLLRLERWHAFVA